MRSVTVFASKGATLVGTLDAASGPVGVLIVSGGREVRAGAHRGMALLAQRLAAAGIPVFRFDRAGVGDSSGVDRGFEGSLPDIFNAALVFGNALPTVRAVVGFGNCDAAAALAMFGTATGADRVVLANPWLGPEADTLPPAAAIAARYAMGLRDPAQWRRFLSGQVSLRRLGAGIAKLVRRPPPAPLSRRVMDGIARWGDRADVVLADGDATAINYRAAAGVDGAIVIDTASHSFADAIDPLIAAVVGAVAREVAGLDG